MVKTVRFKSYQEAKIPQGAIILCAHYETLGDEFIIEYEERESSPLTKERIK